MWVIILVKLRGANSWYYTAILWFYGVEFLGICMKLFYIFVILCATLFRIPELLGSSSWDSWILLLLLIFLPQWYYSRVSIQNSNEVRLRSKSLSYVCPVNLNPFPYLWAFELTPNPHTPHPQHTKKISKTVVVHF